MGHIFNFSITQCKSEWPWLIWLINWHKDVSCKVFIALAVSIDSRQDRLVSTTTQKSALHRRNYGMMNHNMAREADWSVPDDCSVDNHYVLFLEILNSICDCGIPLTRPQGRKNRLYMTREVLTLQNRKKKAWREYARTRSTTGTTTDYYRFLRVRAELRALTTGCFIMNVHFK